MNTNWAQCKQKRDSVHPFKAQIQDKMCFFWPKVPNISFKKTVFLQNVKDALCTVSCNRDFCPP